jgi:anti-anti-sigma factor
MCGEDFGGSVAVDADVTTVVLHGEADLAVRARFQELVEQGLATTSPLIVVDLSRLRYLESACLRSLLHAHEASAQKGRRFVVRGADGIVLRVLEVSGVAEILVDETPPEPPPGG